ncbi:MAG TPA: RNA polymerase sigma factor [Elusimicrobiota bacterium]|nr:RNA polymerase sigma factor [Elusimicrobiota bacterium]HNG45552.1 RNA polymerase sigma factor [Elusimicrobiota bacterium]
MAGPLGMEEQWIVDSKAGDPAAFGQLVAAHQKQLFGFLYSYTGRRDVADELTQEAFLKAWGGMKGFRAESRFQTWLFQIGLNLLRSWGRRETVRRWREVALVFSRPEDERPRSVADLAPDERADADPHRNAEGRERGAALRVALARLPPKEKAVFLLRHEQGMALADIAATLGIAEGTVKAHLFHAVQKLRRTMEEGT